MKPVNPRLNRKHPLSGSLVASYDFARGLNETLNPELNPLTPGGSWVWSPSRHGHAYDSNGADTGDTLGISGEPTWYDQFVARDKFSIESVFYPQADAGSFASFFLSISVSGSPFRLIEQYFERFGNGWAQSLANGSGTDPNVSGSVSGGEIIHVIGTVNGRDHSLYVNGYGVSSETADADPPTDLSCSSMEFAATNWDRSMGAIRFYNQALSPSAVYGQFARPFDIVSGERSRLYFYSGAAVQDITAPLQSSGALYTPTVTAGPVSVELPVQSSGTLHTPAVSGEAVEVDAPLISSSASLLTPAVVIRPYDLSAPLIASTSTTTAPTVVLEETLQLPGISSASSLYTPSLSVASSTVSLPIASGSNLFAPEIEPQDVSIDLPALGGSQLYSPSVDQATTLAAPVIESSATLATPEIILGDVALALPLIGGTTLHAPRLGADTIISKMTLSAESRSISLAAEHNQVLLTTSSNSVRFFLSGSFESSAVSPGAEVTQLIMPALASTSTVAAPELVVQPVDIGAPVISSTSTTYAPAMVQAQDIRPPDIANASTAYAPTASLAGYPLAMPVLTSGTLFSPELELSVTAPLLAATTTLHEPSIGAAGLLEMPLLSSGEIHTPAVGTLSFTLNAPALSSTAALHSPWLERTAGAPTTVSGATALSLAQMGFTTTLPADPITTASVTVTTPAELNAALGTSANHITITGDMSGSTFTIPTGRSDLLIDGSSANTGTWYMSSWCQRIKFEGVRMEGMIIGYPSSDESMCRDLQFVDCVCINGGHDDWGVFFELRGKRVLISGCRSEDIIDRYAVWFDGGASISEDIVIFNNYFDVDGAESGMRLYNTHRLTVVKNMVQSGFKHCFRLHSSGGRATENVYAGYNQWENRGIMFATISGDQVNDVMIEHTVQTVRDNGRGGEDSMCQLDLTGRLDSLTFQNNWAATNDQDQFPGNASSASGQDDWTWSSNTVVYLDGTARSFT